MGRCGSFKKRWDGCVTGSDLHLAKRLWEPVWRMAWIWARWMWRDQSESCWCRTAKVIIHPKETAKQITIRTRYSNRKYRTIGHCFHMGSRSLSLARSFIYILQYLALLADGMHFYCSGCLNSQGLPTWCCNWFSLFFLWVSFVLLIFGIGLFAWIIKSDSPPPSRLRENPGGGGLCLIYLGINTA